METPELCVKICSKLTIKILEQRQWRRSGAFMVSCELISHILVVFPLLTLNKQLLPHKFEDMD